MSLRGNNECAFCKQGFTEKDTTVMVTFPYKITINDTSINLEAIEGNNMEVSHEDCWEGRNGFAPARRRIIQITEVTPR